jgi:hypothetical protein
VQVGAHPTIYFNLFRVYWQSQTHFGIRNPYARFLVPHWTLIRVFFAVVLENDSYPLYCFSGAEVLSLSIKITTITRKGFSDIPNHRPIKEAQGAVLNTSGIALSFTLWLAFK